MLRLFKLFVSSVILVMPLFLNAQSGDFKLPGQQPQSQVAVIETTQTESRLPTDRYEKIVFGCYTTDLEDFEDFVKKSKSLGATHINITAEDLPKSFWQYDTPGDPYPAWVITNIGLLKICRPEALEPYLPEDYAEKVMEILEQRCKILRKHGLKAAFSTFEPQMLPEKVFTDHPLWRGARVDHPMRSNVARFAPTIDNPEVLDLYRESLAMLIKRCPEIEMLDLHTNDSGTGLDWSGGLYSGRFGNTLYSHIPMDKRLLSFFNALQQGVAQSGGALEINIVWTREENPAKISRKLKKGMAIENLEGPDATPYQAQTGFLLDYDNLYYPVIGIPQPIAFLEGLQSASQSPAPRLVISIGDRYNKELYFQIYEKFWNAEINDEISKLMFLKEIAAGQVGKENAGELLKLWLALGETKKMAGQLNNGGYIFANGGVMQRWITRPFLPFPEELKPDEKEYYRRFQFQARAEEHANDMADLQANRVYSGWSGKWAVSKMIWNAKNHLKVALECTRILQDNLNNEQKEFYKLLGIRLHTFNLLTNNVLNTVSYQAQLDRVKELNIKPDSHNVIGAGSDWDRQLMLETARKEIDNTALLMEILKTSSQPLLDVAPTKEQEDIRRLGPDLVGQLQKKLDIMNAHWEDYKRIFNTPNK